jgi:predicted transposase YdaD
VKTVLWLLRREADGPNATGILRHENEDGGQPTLTFRYTVVRVWRLSPDTLLTGGLATLPLAPISNVSASDLPRVVRAVEERITRDAPPEQADILRVCAYNIMGLRYPTDLVNRLFQGANLMEESVTYQAILARGEARGEARGLEQGRLLSDRQAIVRVGRKRLGEPTPQTLTALETIGQTEQLERLLDRILEVKTWEELFQTL